MKHRHGGQCGRASRIRQWKKPDRSSLTKYDRSSRQRPYPPGLGGREDKSNTYLLTIQCWHVRGHKWAKDQGPWEDRAEELSLPGGPGVFWLECGFSGVRWHWRGTWVRARTHAKAQRWKSVPGDWGMVRAGCMRAIGCISRASWKSQLSPGCPSRACVGCYLEAVKIRNH